MEENYTQETEINLSALFKLLLRKWYLIGICFVLGTTLAGLYTFLNMEDVYTATSSMMVLVDSDTQNENTNLQTGTNLVDTYTVFVTSNTVLSRLQDQLDLNYTTNQLKQMIRVSSADNTILINLEVSSANPSEASEIANELVVIVHDEAIAYESMEDVEIFDEAVVPLNPSGPNRPLYIIMGAMIGSIMGIGGIFFYEILDRKIKNKKDIENKLELKVLGVIPLYDLPEGDFNNG